jgi:hypothetical protein
MLELITGYNAYCIVATSSKLHKPYGTWLDILGNVYIADTLNKLNRRVLKASNIITTIVEIPNLKGYSGKSDATISSLLNSSLNVIGRKLVYFRFK